MAEDSEKNTLADLIKLLSEEVPDTREELLNTIDVRFKKFKEKLICPYIGHGVGTKGTGYLCNYYHITKKKPQRIDCYICHNTPPKG